MLRAGLFIGVDRTGDLPILRDAAAGAGRMYQWALQQGLRDQTRARLLTNTDGAEVTPDQIFDAIETITRGGVDQLIVYFAGHGVIINRGEQWLLTHAPANSNAAAQRRRDPCRACPAMAVSSMSCSFPTPAVSPPRESGPRMYVVAISFPTRPHSTSPNPSISFTPAVSARLPRKSGTRRRPPRRTRRSTLAHFSMRSPAREPRCSSRDDADGRSYHLVRPRTLQSYLHTEVPLRVRGLGLKLVNQNPDAIITSDGRWLARIEHASVATPEVFVASPSVDESY